MTTTDAAQPRPGGPPGRIVESLLCPVCRAGLRRTADSLRCPAGHAFDIARQGYVNLRAGHGAAGTADTAAMVADRAEFLAAGHYAPLADALAERAAEVTPDPGGLLVDAGAGIGHYLGAVLDRLPGAAGLALDVSAVALRRAARRHAGIGAVVWDVWRPWPVRDGVASVVLNVFAPRNGAEFRRVLRPDGALLVVTPAPDHLAELGAGLLAVDPRKEERLAGTLAEHFALVGTRAIARELTLAPDDVRRVIGMGPAAHHRGAGGHDDPAGPVPVTASFLLSTYRPRP